MTSGNRQFAASGVMSALARDARLLRDGQRCPVDVRPAIRRLGMKLELRDSDSLGGEGALLHEGGGWVVAVADPDLSRPRTRFTIAHEIGHRLLDLYGVPRPEDRGDYWRTEGLCHYFAGQFLVSDEVVSWVAGAEDRDPVELLRRAQVASQRARVSPAALSHRLSEDLEHCSFCEVRLSSPRPDVVGIVDWIVERFPWLGVRARRHVHSGHFLAGALRSQRRIGAGEIARGYLNGLPAASVRRGSRVWMLGIDPALAHAPSPDASQLSLGLAG
jgi:hypothetical protein